VQVLQCIAGAENLLAGQFMVPRSSRLQRNRDRENWKLSSAARCTLRQQFRSGRSPNDASRPPVDLRRRMKMIS